MILAKLFILSTPHSLQILDACLLACVNRNELKLWYLDCVLYIQPPQSYGLIFIRCTIWNSHEIFFFSYVTRIRDRSGKEAIIYKLLWAVITTWWYCIEESLQFFVVQPVNTAISNRKINESLNCPHYSL